MVRINDPRVISLLFGRVMFYSVLGAGLSFAFLKTASYGELFWLPDYLKKEFDMGGKTAFIA